MMASQGGVVFRIDRNRRESYRGGSQALFTVDRCDFLEELLNGDLLRADREGVEEEEGEGEPRHAP